MFCSENIADYTVAIQCRKCHSNWQLREKVNGVKCVHNVWCVTRGPPDYKRNS